MYATDQWRLLILALGASAWMLCAAALDPGGALYLVPALLLFAPLFLGRYAGEETIVRLARAVRRARRRRGEAPLPPARLSSPVRVPRGAMLLGEALAERAPPALVP